MTVLLTSAYWPNLHYFYYVIHSNPVFIEYCENYQKQSYRNRTEILSANGLLALSIPVQKKKPKEASRDIFISYQENWQNRHWRAIVSAYKNSPYFDYFEDDIRRFYTQRFDRLMDYNLEQTQQVLNLLKLKKEILFSASFEKEVAGMADRRFITGPKFSFKEDPEVAKLLERPYYQTFSAKFQFVPNLSILDLLFNKGLQSLDYLTRGSSHGDPEKTQDAG